MRARDDLDDQRASPSSRIFASRCNIYVEITHANLLRNNCRYLFNRWLGAC
jgi:hypothetical protein